MIKKQSALIIFIIIELSLIAALYFSKDLSLQISNSILTSLFLIAAPLIYYMLIRKKQTEFTFWFVFYMTFKITPYLFSMENNIFHIIFNYKIYLNLLFLFYLIIKAITFIRTFKKKIKENKVEDIDEYTFISNSLKEFVKFKKLGEMIAFEVCSFYYCFIKLKGSDIKSNYFTGYKNSGVGAIYFGLMFVSIVEAVGVHFLLISWSKNFAIIFLILHIYLLINLIGHLKAIFFRRHLITEKEIIIRYGLFDTLEIPINSINSIYKYEADYEKSKKLVKFALLGRLEPHNIYVDLKSNIPVRLPFGIKKNPKVILFYVDNVLEFVDRVNKIGLNPNYAIES